MVVAWTKVIAMEMESRAWIQNVKGLNFFVMEHFKHIQGGVNSKITPLCTHYPASIISNSTSNLKQVTYHFIINTSVFLRDKDL